MVRNGTVWWGLVWYGMVWESKGMQGNVWYGMVWYDIWRGVEYSGVARHGHTKQITQKKARRWTWSWSAATISDARLVAYECLHPTPW